MRDTVAVKRLKAKVFELAQESGYLNAELTLKKFYRHILAYMSLADYCKLIVRAVKAMGGNMEDLREKMALSQTVRERRGLYNGKTRTRARKKRKKKIVGVGDISCSRVAE